MPLWTRLTTTLFLCILVPVYWHHYGPANFLWFSDIALLMITLALWLESRLLAGMAAISVLVLELLWTVGFLVRLATGVHLLGLTDYMFDAALPLYLRALSLFHVAIPPLLLWMLYRLGYEPRAWLMQTALTWVILPCTWWLTTPEQNINWVFGLGSEPQHWMHPLAYLALLMILFPLAVYLPTHLILRSLFRSR